MSELSPILLRRELEEEVKLLRKIRTNREENGICFYRPHFKQHKFHTCGLSNRYCRTGNRFGKSEMGIAEDISYALGGRLWYREAFDVIGTRLIGNPNDLQFEKYIAYSHPGGFNHPFVTRGIPQRAIKGLILVTDWNKAKSVFTKREGSFDTWGKFWKLCPKSAVGKITNGGRGDRIEQIEILRPKEFGGGVSTITFDTIQSYKHSKVSAESDDWDFIHIDEPIPEALYEAHARGLQDRKGSAWFTCTPLDQMWINDLFCPPGQKLISDADLGVSFAKKTGRKNNYYIITGSTYDNPYRSEEGTEEFVEKLTKDKIATRIYGLPATFAGMIYREFQYDLHCLSEVPKGWEDFSNPPKDYTIRVAWDVHDAKPQALLYAATAPTGEVFIYDEQFFDRVIGINAETLKERIAGRQVVDYIIDPRAVIESPVTGESILDELMKYDLWFEKASKDLTLGISKVREKLNERLPNGAPTIYFSPNLAETLFEFTHYVYDSTRGKPKDEHDHMMENLYRLILNGLEYIPLSSDSPFKAKSVSLSHSEYAR